MRDFEYYKTSMSISVSFRVSNFDFSNIRMDTLKRHLPFSGQEGLQELMKIAVRFEGKIYDAATSQVI